MNCHAEHSLTKISMHCGLKLSQLSRCIGQQSRNRKLQVAGPRKYSAARNKDTLFSIKAKRLNRLNDLQRSNYPLTDIKSIYAAFKVAITSFLLSVRIYEDIFSLRWLNAWDILYKHSYKVPFAWACKGCCWFLLKKFLWCNPFRSLIKKVMEFLRFVKCWMRSGVCW